MSSSRVKRRYDAFLGEDNTPMTASPQCSPMRITSLGASSNASSSPPPAPSPLPPPAAHSAATSSPALSTSFSFGTPSSSSFSSPPPTLAKRARRAGQADVAMDEESNGGNGGAAHQSPFAKLKRAPIEDFMLVPRHYKKQAVAAALSSGSSSSAHSAPVPLPVQGVIPPPPSSSPSSQLPSHAHQLFTYEQVASIVRNALDMREEQLRAEYDRTLNDLLREQFENFSSFNRDYISRNMKSLDQQDTEYSYYS